jgi:hypothetical protein
MEFKRKRGSGLRITSDILEKMPTASTWIKPKMEDQRYRIREPKRERVVPEVQERGSRLQDPAMFKRNLKSMHTSINRNMDIGRSKTSMLTTNEINSNTQNPYIFK